MEERYFMLKRERERGREIAEEGKRDATAWGTRMKREGDKIPGDESRERSFRTSKHLRVFEHPLLENSRGNDCARETSSLASYIRLLSIILYYRVSQPAAIFLVSAIHHAGYKASFFPPFLFAPCLSCSLFHATLVVSRFFFSPLFLFPLSRSGFTRSWPAPINPTEFSLNMNNRRQQSRAICYTAEELFAKHPPARLFYSAGFALVMPALCSALSVSSVFAPQYIGLVNFDIIRSTSALFICKVTRWKQHARTRQIFGPTIAAMKTTAPSRCRIIIIIVIVIIAIISAIIRQFSFFATGRVTRNRISWNSRRKITAETVKSAIIHKKCLSKKLSVLGH